jgi:hypothetical protein
MKRTIMLTASTMLIAGIVGMPASAESQTVIIIGNGAAPYYPYSYSYPQVYGAPYASDHYGYGYGAPYASDHYGHGYASSYYYPTYYGHYRPYGWGYRSWWGW